MTTAQTPAPRRHVLLVGIDAYTRVEPLFGSVNDIDAVEALLLDRLRVPEEAITKLTAPHDWHARSPRVPEREATSENIRAALTALAGDNVKPGERVLIWYCGHGTQLSRKSSPRTPREALVPVDAREDSLLYDYELNGLLRRIAGRSGDLTVILDCCCSAGATRSTLRPQGSGVRFCRIDAPKESDARPRSADPSSEAPFRGNLRAANPRDPSEPSPGLLSSLDPSDPSYLVAAACQSNERAHEGSDALGKTRGAFSQALLERLAARPDDHIETMRWADIWQSLREQVTARFPGQSPILLGRRERRLFGGPFRRQDPGYPILREGTKYRLLAGTMAGLTEDARVAVYGPTPDFFPPLNSAEDVQARIGVVRVDSATPSSCTAVGPELPLVEGARGRLLTPGRPEALVVGLEPYDAELAKWLEGDRWMHVVPAAKAASEIEEALVGTDASGMRWIGDEIYGPRGGDDGEPPLVRVPFRDRENLLRGLLHYAKYNLPLRLARRSIDLPGALRVRLLDCRNMPHLTGEELQDPELYAKLSEVPADPKGRYRYLIGDGQPVCIVVENTSSERLYTTLINCATSGRVELLGGPLEIPSRQRQTFWLHGHLGSPFPYSLPPGRSSGVERLIVAATTAPNVDLSPLEQNKSFDEVIGRTYRDMVPRDPDPRELWTATMVTTKIVRVPAGSEWTP
jgi:hypothetical protein